MAIPQIPQQLVVQQADRKVLVSWNIVPGATSYTIQRSLDGITYTNLVTGVLPPQYEDAAVTISVKYYYQVAAVNGSGTSPFTNPLFIIPSPAGEMSLGELRLRSKQRAEREASQFVTDEEWNSYINQSYFELYDILVQAYGNEYYVAPGANFQTVGSTRFYPLPDGFLTFYDTSLQNSFAAPPFYKLLGVDLALDASSQAYITLKKFQFISRNRYVYPQITTNLLGVAGMRYRIMGNQIEFIPTPQGGQVIQLWYVPRMVSMLKDTDLCDGVSGWTEYIITDAAIKALQKEESDVQILMAQKMALIDRIQSAAENRDIGEPELISDTRRYTDLYGFGSPGSDGGYGGN